MLDCELATIDGGEEVYLDLRNQVVSTTPEAIVRLLLYDDDDVSGRDTWSLITLTIEGDRLPILHALVNMDLEHLLLRDNLARITCLAPIFVIDSLARTVAFVARRLHLLNHGTHLPECDAYTTSLARGTRSYGALLAAFAGTLRADDITGQCKLCRLALVEILEGNLHPVY